MLRNFGRALVALAAMGTVAVGIAPSAQAAPASAPAAIVVRHNDDDVATPRLVDIDFVERRNTDRVVFQFRGGVPDDVSARLVRRVRDRDGDRVTLPGRRFLVLRFADANARRFDTDVIDSDLRTVLAARLVDDGRDDDVVRVALGLRRAGDVRDVQIRESRNRITVDVLRNRDRRDER